jgi:hypothetical protein
LLAANLVDAQPVRIRAKRWTDLKSRQRSEIVGYIDHLWIEKVCCHSEPSVGNSRAHVASHGAIPCSKWPNRRWLLDLRVVIPIIGIRNSGDSIRRVTNAEGSARSVALVVAA